MDDAATDFSAWYKSQPLFTRTFLTISFAFTVLTSLDLLNYAYLYYTFNDAFMNL